MTWIPITTKFASKCAICQEPIAKGQKVMFNPDEHAVIHATCGMPKSSDWNPQKFNLTREIRHALRSDPLTRRHRPNP